MHRKPSREAGFTLIESIIGLFLLSLALLTLMTEFILVSRSVQLGRTRTSGTYLAQSMMERLTNESLSSLELYDDFDSSDPTKYPADVEANQVVTEWVSRLQTDFRRGSTAKINIESPVALGTAGTKMDGLTRITVTVTWPKTSSAAEKEPEIRLVLIRRS